MTSATPQIRMRQVSSAYWIVTFDHRPINLIDPDTIRELDALVSRLEADPDVRVIVFDSADPDFYLAHYDVLVDKQETISMPPGRSGMHPWLDVLTRLSRLPAVTVASIRGRARGAGSEFVLACDVRFASRERAVLGQFEVGIGAVPGGGPMARLPRLVGRGRALEILLGADDFPGELAERYGYVNRAVPDNELDAFVDAFARRIAGFDKRAIAETKAFVDAASLPEDAEFPAALDSFFESVARDGTRQRVIGLVGEGLQQHGGIELDLGRRVGRHDHDESRAG
jgi:enoyl-CoA hydratase/carnithine racemase